MCSGLCVLVHELGMLPTLFRTKTGHHSTFCLRAEHSAEGDPTAQRWSHANTGRREAKAARTLCGKGTGR